MRAWLGFGLGVMILNGAALASPLYSGTTTGIFSDPVLAGIIFNADGSSSALDNTASAVFAGAGTNQIAWGACDTGCGEAPQASTLMFTGVPFAGVAPDEVFRIGTLSYLNGSSLGGTLIFGARLAVGVTGGAAAIEPAAVQMGFRSTSNGNVNKFADADSVSFDVVPFSFFVFEGATAVADVYGYVHGDPQLVIGDITLPPDQVGNGFLAPEPASAALLGLGLAGAAWSRRRARGENGARATL